MTDASPTSSPDPDLGFFLALEHRVWEALATGDAAADTELLDPAFVGVYPDGVASRADHAAQVAAGPSVGRYAIEAARLLRLSPDAVLLSYHATYTRPGDGGGVPWRAMYVSSVWTRRGTRWVNVFSQDTPARDAGG